MDQPYLDGDIYWNPVFGDLWVVDGKSFVQINRGYTIEINETEGFVKVGRIWENICNGRKSKKVSGSK